MKGHSPQPEKFIFEDFYLPFFLKYSLYWCLPCHMAVFLNEHMIYSCWKEYVFGYCWVECFILSKSFIFILVVRLLVLSTKKKRALKFPTIIVELFISPFSFCLIYFDSLLKGTSTFGIVLFPWELALYHYKMSLFISSNSLSWSLLYLILVKPLCLFCIL